MRRPVSMSRQLQYRRQQIHLTASFRRTRDAVSSVCLANAAEGRLWLDRAGAHELQAPSVVVYTPCDMPVAMPRHTPMIQRVQKTVEVPQIQYVDNTVEAPVVVIHQPVPVEAEAFLRVEDVRRDADCLQEEKTFHGDQVC